MCKGGVFLFFYSNFVKNDLPTPLKKGYIINNIYL